MKTKLRSQSGIPVKAVGSKTTHKGIQYTLVKEVEVRDGEGYIIGVQTIWQ